VYTHDNFDRSNRSDKYDCLRIDIYDLPI